MAYEEIIDSQDTGLRDAFAAALEGKLGYETEPTNTVEDVVIETPPVVEAPSATEQPTTTFDFSTASDGYVKDEDGFKSTVQKAKERDELETKLKETEGKVINFSNDESKRIYELIASGNEAAAADYLSEKRRDYKTMSDLDVVRTALQKANPNWTGKDVELELRAEYGKQLELIDLSTIDKEDNEDQYLKAEAHNEKVEENLLRLQRAARDNRLTLIEQQSKIKLPEIKQEATQLTSTAPTAQEVADAEAKWQKDVDEALPKLGSIKQTIDDKEVEYSFTNTENKDFGDEMRKFNLLNFAKGRGWYNADGSTNVVKLAEDVRKLSNFDKITKAFATQVKTDTTKKVIAEIKNIDPPKKGSGDATPQSIEEAYWDARDKSA